MSTYQSGGVPITGPLAGTETVVVGNGGPQITTVTTKQIADLAGSGESAVNTAINTVGNGTLTAAGIVGRLITRGGVQTGPFSDATATAAAIILASPGALIGDSWYLDIENNTTYAETLTNGTGVTVSVITVIPALMMGRFLVTYTAAATITMVGLQLSSINGTITDAIQNGNTVSTATITANTTTVIANITGLSVNLTSTGTYTIDAHVVCTGAANAGIKVAFSGTATATSLNASTWAWNGTTLNTMTNITALSSNLAATTTANTDVIVKGSIVVNAAGTLTLAAAQNVLQASNTTFVAGSTMNVQRVS